MAHGAMPHAGRNPIPVLARLVVALDELGAALAAQHPAHPDLGELYVTPTVVTAGDPAQMNVIPAIASLSLDVRTLPGVDHAQLVELIRTLADQLAAEAGNSALLTVIDDRPPVDLHRDHPVVRALAAAHAEVTGCPPVFGGVPGTTDGTILTRDAGLPIVVYGPGGKWVPHTADEFVEVDDVLTCARVYAVAATRFLAEGS
jgi:succinyl-diaminopimelate desuccinylase